MFKEHVNPSTTETNPASATELLVLSLELVKNRVGVMSPEMRKLFIGVILVQLMEKSNDVSVIKVAIAFTIERLTLGGVVVVFVVAVVGVVVAFTWYF